MHALIDRLWPRLTAGAAGPRPVRLPRAAGRGDPRAGPTPTATLLLRPPSSPWTPADVPLLEEADELLGVDDSAQRAAARRGRAAPPADAQATLDLLHGSRSTDAETEEEAEELLAFDLLDAEGLAARHEERDTRTTAERAAADRTWTYGHVIVDEAQELSAMAWRLLLRRCPTRSMTRGRRRRADRLPGRRDQLGRGAHPAPRHALAAGGADRQLPHPGRDHGRRRRGPRRGRRRPPRAGRSVRSTGVHPWALRVAEADARRRGREGRRGVRGRGGHARRPGAAEPGRCAVRQRCPESSDDLTDGPVVLTPAGAKGLEFDSVLVVDPAGIVAEGVRGHNDLYVALTRATQRLGVVHPGDLLPELRGLEARAPSRRASQAPQPPAPQAHPAQAAGRGAGAGWRDPSQAGRGDDQRHREHGHGQGRDDGGDVGGARPALRDTGGDQQPGDQDRPDEQRLTAAARDARRGRADRRRPPSSRTGTATSSTRAASTPEATATTSAAATDDERAGAEAPRTGSQGRTHARRTGPRAAAPRHGRRGTGRGHRAAAGRPRVPEDGRRPRRRSSRCRAPATAARPGGPPRGSRCPGCLRSGCRLRRSPRGPVSLTARPRSAGTATRAL